MAQSTRRVGFSRALNHGSGGWLVALLLSPVFLSGVAALSRPVRRNAVPISIAIAALGVGSLVTVLLVRRWLWGEGVQPRVPMRRLLAAYLAVIACVVAVLTMGAAMPVRDTDRLAAVGPGTGDGTPTPVPTTEPPTTAVTTPPVTTATPTGTPTPTPSSTPTVAVRPITLPPEKLDSIRLIEADVERWDEPGYVGYYGARDDVLFDPEAFVLCSGLQLTKYPITLSTFNSFTGYGDTYYGSEATLFEDVAAANALFEEIRENLEPCGYHTRSGTRHGDETLRFWMKNEHGDYLDYIVFRIRNLIVQVGTHSEKGNHATPADALAAVCARNAARVVPG